jgi:hypothetical protein
MGLGDIIHGESGQLLLLLQLHLDDLFELGLGLLMTGQAGVGNIVERAFDLRTRGTVYATVPLLRKLFYCPQNSSDRSY